MLLSEIGKVELRNGIAHIVTSEGEAGCVVYGPYVVLGPGSYEVSFYAMPSEMSGDVCCVVDVLRRGQMVTAERDFKADELARRDGVIQVRFEVVEEDSFEFRLISSGATGLTVRYHRPVRRLDGQQDEAQTGG